jgi:hypothetical protein
MRKRREQTSVGNAACLCYSLGFSRNVPNFFPHSKNQDDVSDVHISEKCSYISFQFFSNKSVFMSFFVKNRHCWIFGYPGNFSMKRSVTSVNNALCLVSYFQNSRLFREFDHSKMAFTLQPHPPPTSAPSPPYFSPIPPRGRTCLWFTSLLHLALWCTPRTSEYKVQWLESLSLYPVWPLPTRLLFLL